MPIDGVYVTLESLPYGGGYEAIKQSLDGYEKKGLNVKLICPKTHDVEKRLPNTIPIKLNSLENGQNPMDYKNRTERIYELCKKAEPIVKKLKPDVIISHVYHAAFLLDKFPKTKRVYRACGLKGHMAEVAKKNNFNLPYGSDVIENLIKMEDISIKNCDSVRTISKSNADWISKKYKIDLSDVHLIPEGISTDVFKKKKVKKSGKVLFAGRCDNQIKGMDVLLRAIHNVKNKGVDLKADVVSNNNPFQNFPELISDMNLSKSLNYRGFSSHENMPAVYSEADVVVIPSYFECFGMVCTEAMSCETPVLASNVGGLRDQLDGWDEQKFQPGNSQELGDKLKEVFSGAYDLSSWGKRERKRVEENYDLSKIIDKEIQTFFN